MILDFDNQVFDFIDKRTLFELGKYEKILIFGAGLSGEWAYNLLDQKKVYGFIDSSTEKQRQKKFDLPIYSLSNAISRYPDAGIAIASMWYEEILSQIKQFDEQLLLHCFNCLNTMNWETLDMKQESAEPSYIRDHLDEFEKVGELLSDQVSKNTLTGLLNYRITRNIKYLESIKSPKETYIDADIITPKATEYIYGKGIIDGGAYIGDSLKTFIDIWGQNNTYYCYELDDKNITSLLSCAGLYKDIEINVQQKALWNTSNQILYTDGDGLSGKIGNGNKTCHSISIDDNLYKTIGFIKMDIEGAEREAIIGAKETILRDKPILAICAYHLQDDLLVLPQLIKSIYPNYKLYLRHYMLSSGDTILYAIPE